MPDHPDHEKARRLKSKRHHAVNPTVLHESYHTLVFKLKRKPDETVHTLLSYMDSSVCLAIDSSTVELGLKLGQELSLGGRDALILASYASSKQVNKFVTFDQTLLSIKQVKFGRKMMKIIGPEDI